jgi:hypothetical protein
VVRAGQIAHDRSGLDEQTTTVDELVHLLVASKTIAAAPNGDVGASTSRQQLSV